MNHRNWIAAGALLLAAQIVRPAPPPATLDVGGLTLSYCNSDYDGYCGSIVRPLDPIAHAPGTITIGFEFYPRFDRRHAALGTILTQEGGPGYSSTGTRDAYVGLFAPLRTQRDILIVDKRGTGTSGALDCPALQAGTGNYAAALAACGRQLGKSAWYYGSALAAADVVAVLDALQIDRVDYYGDSYGTYFGQTMAARFPQRLRSIVLDSAYPVRPPDVWFPTDWTTARDGFDLVCERSVPCRSLGHRSTTLLTTLLNAVRKHPIKGRAPDADGNIQQVTLDAPTLFLTMDGAGNYPTVYRDLDAAARAWFEAGDRLPLLRLAAEVNTGGGSDPTAFSAALYTAVICQEYPLLYDLAALPAQRRAAFRAGINDVRAQRASLFAPFTIDEVLASDADITPLDVCLDWPAPPAGYAQGDALPAHPVFPAVPTLVLSGDLDAVTSPTDAAQAAAQFPNVTHLIIPNLTHITAFSVEDDNIVPAGADLTHCVSKVVLHFIADLAPGDTGCLPRIRPIRTVPRFARSVDDLDPASAEAGNAGGALELKIAAAAAETVGDAIARFYVSTSGADTGLRGGSYTYMLNGNGYLYQLSNVQWTDDLAVSGSIDWNQQSSLIAAQLTLSQAGRNVGQLTVSWNDRVAAATATLRGVINGKVIRAHRIAP